MKIKRWNSIQVKRIIGLCQEYTPPKDWSYQPDWLVDTISLDTRRRSFWITGRLITGESFYWELDCRRPLYWRYDLTNTRYFIGSHEK